MSPSRFRVNPVPLGFPVCPGESRRLRFPTQFLAKIAKQAGNLSTL
jgi:hypothetical protein